MKDESDSSQLPKEQNKFFGHKDEMTRLRAETGKLRMELDQMDRRLQSSIKHEQKNRFEKYGILPPELNEASRKNFQAVRAAPCRVAATSPPHSHTAHTRRIARARACPARTKHVSWRMSRPARRAARSKRRRRETDALRRPRRRRR